MNATIKIRFAACPNYLPKLMWSASRRCVIMILL